MCESLYEILWHSKGRSKEKAGFFEERNTTELSTSLVGLASDIVWLKFSIPFRSSFIGFIYLWRNVCYDSIN